MSRYDDARRDAQLTRLRHRLAADLRALVADLGQVLDVEAGLAAVTAVRPGGGGERGRLQAPGHRVDDGSHHTLLLVQEADRDWTIHGLGVAVRLEEVVMAQVCRAVLATHAQGPGALWSWYLRDPRDLMDAHLESCCLTCSVAQARCGAVFKPAAVLSVGEPPVRAPEERVCAQCQAGAGGAP